MAGHLTCTLVEMQDIRRENDGGGGRASQLPKMKTNEKSFESSLSEEVKEQSEANYFATEKGEASREKIKANLYKKTDLLFGTSSPIMPTQPVPLSGHSSQELSGPTK